MDNMNGPQTFQNLRTHYDGPGEHLQRVTEANQIFDTIHYKKKNTVVTFEVYITRIKEAYKVLKDHGEIHNDAQKVQTVIKGIRNDAPSYLHTTIGIVQMNPTFVQ